MSNQFKSWYHSIMSELKVDDVFWHNEVRANIFVSFCMMLLAGVLVLSFILAAVGVFDVPLYQMGVTLAVNLPLLALGVALNNIFRGQKKWLKYLLCIICIYVTGALCSILSIFVTLILAIPVCLSVRYYSAHLTRIISALSVLDMLGSELIYGMHGMVNLNLVSVPEGSVLMVANEGLRGAVVANGYDVGSYIGNLIRGSFMPRFLLYAIISIICVDLAKRAHDNIIEQAEISKKTESMAAELSMATSIQSGVLPKIFPPFPNHKEFDIFASMSPAKEVGGDFYDFYMIDDDHLCVVMADVSGKGVPAALFMMVSKILLKTHACNGLSPAEIAETVNEQLCSDNEAEMFVTVWLGILEISTGKITCIDAGHENPVIRHAGGQFEVFKDKKSFVLAGMEGVKFRETTFNLGPGDTLFLYTDGIPEATNADNELFGIDRMLQTLNRDPEATPEQILNHITEDVNAFVQDAPQFDDLTMLALYYTGPAE